MANVVVDPGFELNDPAWSWLGSAQRVNDISAHGGGWDAHLFARKDSFLGNASSILDQQAIPVTSGESRALTFWYRATDPGPTQLDAELNPGTGSLPVAQPPAVDDWTLYVSETVEMAGSEAGVAFILPIPASDGSGTWEIDDVSLLLESELSPEAVMQRGKYAAYSALVTTLSGINGSTGGYYNSLSGKVRTAWQTPEEIGDRVYDPYICLPFDGDSEQIQPIQKNIYKTTWRQRVYGYVNEPSSELAVSSAVEKVCQLRDDILRALMADITLGGKVRESRIDGIQTIAGIGLGYGEVRFEIVFEEWFTRDQLGPFGD